MGSTPRDNLVGIMPPKTIPIGVFKNAVGQPLSVLLILSGDHLIDTNGKQSQTYTRVR